MIYLDNMGHCYSDTSLEELYDFCVVKLGLRPEWNHYSREFPHFDIRDKSYRARVIELGAIPIANREMVRLVRQEITPYKNLREAGVVPLIEETFRGKKITRIDFKKYLGKK